MNIHDFINDVWNEHGTGEFVPGVQYDHDGDCLEFFATNDAYLRERLDKWVTVYRRRSDQRVIGSLIKNVRELLDQNPLLKIQIERGPVRLTHLLLASGLDATEQPEIMLYRELIDEAEKSDAKAELVPA